MNEWLAKIYGTGGGDDLEKIAQAEMAQELAGQEGLDLSGMSEDQLASLSQEVLGQQGQQAQQGAPEINPEELTEEHIQQAQEILANAEQFDPAVVQEAQAIMQVAEQLLASQATAQPGFVPPQAAQPQQAEMAKVAEAQAKFEEADFLGRVMAHAFSQEMDKIASIGSKAVSMAGRAAKSVDRGAQRLGKRVVEVVTGAGRGAAERLRPGTARAIGYGVPVAGLAGGYGIAKAVGGKSKEASAVEAAAQKLAADILAQNGIDPATVQQPTAQAAPAPNAQQVVNGLIEKRAHQILASLGYTVE